MYYFQVSDGNQQILEEQLRQSKQSGYELWFQNSHNNIHSNLNNQQIFNNMQQNFNENPPTLNQTNSNQQMSSLRQSNLSLSNNFRNSVQQLNDEGAINCNRCSRAPIDYISLNCGHNFCLECMAISVVRGEGRVVQQQYSETSTKNIPSGFDSSDDNTNSGQIDSICCYTCGQESELEYQSRSAIYIFIQMFIQKYEQKQNMISSQQSENGLMTQQLNQQAISSQTSASAAFGQQIPPNQVGGLLNANGNNQMNIGNQVNQMNLVNNQLNMQNNQINAGNAVNINNNMQANQIINQNNNQINAINNIRQSDLKQQQQGNNQIIDQKANILQQQQLLLNQQLQQQQQQIQQQTQINGDEVQQYYDNNVIQYDSNNPRSARIQKEDQENEDGQYYITNKSTSTAMNNNRVSNYVMNGNDVCGSEDDLPQYGSVENMHISQKGVQLNQQNDVNTFQYQQQLQQQQQYESRNRLISPTTNENTSNNVTVLSQNNQLKQNYEGIQINGMQQQQTKQNNVNNNYETPYIKQQQQQQSNMNSNVGNMLSSDKVRVSQHEQIEDMNQQSDTFNLQSQKAQLQQQSANEKQILLQQQDNQNSSNQNNLISTPNYYILTEKKPTQPQYGQLIPTNNQTPQNTSNQAKKNSHLSKSTHIMSNDGNHTPYQQIGGKTVYNPNAAQSQQFQQEIHSYHHHPQQFLINQPPFYNGITTNKNNALLQIDEHQNPNQLQINDQRNNQQPKLSAFSASNSKNQTKQNSHHSNLQPYGNAEDMTNMFEGQVSYNPKHMPYRQQSQLETGIIEECETNQIPSDNNLQYENGIATNIKQLQNQNDGQQNIHQNSQQYQHVSRIQLQQVDEIRESNSAVNSIVGGSITATQINCNDHPFNELSLYCFTCDNRLLCIKCLQNGEHRDHDVQSVQKNFEYLLGKMEETSHEINASIELMAIQEKILADKRKECLKQIKIIKEQIQDNIQDVKVSLVNKEQHLLQQAEQRFTIKQSEIQQEIQNIQSKALTLQEVKNQFEFICEAYFKKKVNNLYTDRDDESVQTEQQHQQYLQQQQQVDQKQQQINQQNELINQQVNSVQQQLGQIVSSKQTNYLSSQSAQSQGQPQQKNIRQLPQHLTYEIINDHSSSEEFHDTIKSFSEQDKINYFRFYSECKNLLCQNGITRNSQMNDRLNNTQYLQQQSQSPQYSSYHLTPHQVRTTQLNETPRSRNNLQQQQFQFQNISQSHKSGQTSNYQSNQPSSYIQQHQLQQQGPQRNINIESQYASVRSQTSQAFEEEEQLQMQQQQQQQNQQQYNLMSSQDLSQLIDDVQRIKKEAIMIDLQNYNHKQNTTLNTSNSIQKDPHNSSAQPPQRSNQLFHDYLNQQRYQNQLLQQQQTQSQNIHQLQNLKAQLDGNAHLSSSQKDLSEEYQFHHNQNNQQNNLVSSRQKMSTQNQINQQNFQMENDQQLKEPQKITEQPAVSSYSQYLLNRLQQNAETHNINDHQSSNNNNNYNKINSSYLNQSSSYAIPTQTSDTELLKRDLTKNNSHLKQKKSKWLDEETLEQDHEYFHNYHPQQYQSVPLNERFNSIENGEQGNYKQKQEFNKHLDNIFRKNGGNLTTQNLLNKINSPNSFDYSRNNKLQMLSNSALMNINGYQTERLNTNSNNQQVYLDRSQNNTVKKQNQDKNTQKLVDSPSTVPFSPNFKSPSNLRGQHSYTTRPSNQNQSVTRQQTSNHLKVNASLSTHNTSQKPNTPQYQLTQSFVKQNTNQSINQRSVKVQSNQVYSQRDRSNNIDSLLETLRVQKEQFNQKKKKIFLFDQ